MSDRGGLISTGIYLTVVVVGLPAGPHVYLLCVVVVGQLVQVVVDRLEHQVSSDLFRSARVKFDFPYYVEYAQEVGKNNPVIVIQLMSAHDRL